MFFRNLTFFRFPASMNFDQLDAGLAECALKPVGPLELASYGFVPPLGRDTEELSHRSGDCIWITLGGEERVLPAAAVNEAVSKKIAEIEHHEGRRLGGRARKRIKEEIVLDMLPRSFVEPVSTNAFLDLKEGYIAVDTGSARKGEQVVSEIRRALGSFPALPLQSQGAPASVLTLWLSDKYPPDPLAIGDECVLKDRGGSGASATIQQQDLLGNEIREHLESGKVVAKLGLLLGDHLSFVLSDVLVVRKLKFLDAAVESLENSEIETILDELRCRFVLMTLEVRKLFKTLDAQFRLCVPEALFHQPSQDNTTVTIRWERGAGGDLAIVPDTSDPLFEKAKELVFADQSASISHLQRKLQIGYNRAAHLMASLEAAGFVTPPAIDGSRSVITEQTEHARGG